MKSNEALLMSAEALWFINEFGDEILELGKHWELSPREAMNWIMDKGRVEMILATKTERVNDHAIPADALQGGINLR